MILALARVIGVGVETAIVLVYEVFSRSFKDRRALAAFVGLTGTPYQQRRLEDRAGNQQERQCAGAPDAEPTGVALADASARERACAVV